MTKSKMAAKIPEILKNGYNSFIIYLRVVILVSTAMFWVQGIQFDQNKSYLILR